MMHFGGPTYVRTARVATTDIVRMYGQTPAGNRGRSGTGTGDYESNNYEILRIYANGGDSGAPLMTADGGAFGSMHGFSFEHPGGNMVIRWAPAKADAEGALGIRLALVTAPLCAVSC